jgi:hypothetical protein
MLKEELPNSPQVSLMTSRPLMASIH